MSADDESSTSLRNKGKSRASPPLDEPSPTESTPLLANAELESSSEHRRRSLPSRLLLPLLVLPILLLPIFLICLAQSYSPRPSASAVALRTPSAVHLRWLTDDGGMWLHVDISAGVDAGQVMSVKPSEDDSILAAAWKAVGRWGIRRMGKVTVEAGDIDIFSSYPSDYHSKESDPEFLATITIPPFTLPLTPLPPFASDDSWLTKLSLPILIRPTQNSSTWVRFARTAWRTGTFAVFASAESVKVIGGGRFEGGWRKWLLNVVQRELVVPVRQKLPLLPNLPPPGPNEPFPNLSSLLTIKDLHLTSPSSSNGMLDLSANVSLPNVIPPSLYSTTLSTPPIPFEVWLAVPSQPNDSFSAPLIPFANLTLHPLHPPPPPQNLTLTLTGHLLTLTSSPSSHAALSALLSSYLTAHPHPFTLRTPLLPALTLHVDLPPPHPKPRILRHVTIRDMRIKAAGTEMRASGEVRACAVLPPGMDLALDVRQVLPDVLVFDGAVPGALSPPQPPPAPLPDPLPARAFAHIRPEDWLAATSTRVRGCEDDVDGAGATLVRAQIVDVPLEVLPGREREFSNFVGKVIFGTQPALAGLQGTAAVSVNIAGLSGADDEGMVLMGLPFEGLVRIGKRKMGL